MKESESNKISTSRSKKSPNPRKKLILFLVATILLVILATVVVISIRNHQQKLVAAEKLSQERQLYIDFRNDFNKLKADLNTLDPGVEWEGDSRGSCAFSGGVGLRRGTWQCHNSIKVVSSSETIDLGQYAGSVYDAIKSRHKNEFIPYALNKTTPVDNAQEYFEEGAFTYRRGGSFFCRILYRDTSTEYDKRALEDVGVKHSLYFTCSSKPTYSWYPNDSLAPLAPGIDAWKGIE